jgi:CHAD domain-containing protein
VSYRFEPSDVSVQAGLRRIAREQLEAAAQGLRAGDGATRGVHEARKALKKTRALLRLVRPGMRDFAMENATLRDIARSLAPMRDAHVTAGLIARLCEGAGVPVPESVGSAPVPDAPNVLRDAARALDDAAVRADAWRLRGAAKSVLAEGLEATVAAGRKALEAGVRGDDGERLHRFRKRVKDRWYHARLLQSAWPEAMQVEAEAAGTLGEVLGDWHDLDVVAGRLGAAMPAALEACITERGQALLAEARPLARRLYAEKPGAVADRLLGWWSAAGLPSG